MVAWLRLPAIALIALGQGIEDPNAEHAAFVVALVLFAAWSAGVLVWVHARRSGQAELIRHADRSTMSRVRVHAARV